MIDFRANAILKTNINEPDSLISADTYPDDWDINFKEDYTIRGENIVSLIQRVNLLSKELYSTQQALMKMRDAR